jgi:hypothetical protein
MREYGMAFDAVLDLPLKRFWFLVNQVDRLRAEQDLRHIQLLGSAEDGEMRQVAMDNLKTELGKVYVWTETEPTEIRIDHTTGLDPEFDREGLNALRALSELREGYAA